MVLWLFSPPNLMVNMNIGAWNIMGLNSPFKNNEILAFLNKQIIHLMGVLETRIRGTHSQIVQRHYGNVEV